MKDTLSSYALEKHTHDDYITRAVLSDLISSLTNMEDPDKGFTTDVYTKLEVDDILKNYITSSVLSEISTKVTELEGFMNSHDHDGIYATYEDLNDYTTAGHTHKMTDIADFTIDWNSITSKPDLSLDWDSITSKPNIALEGHIHEDYITSSVLRSYALEGHIHEYYITSDALNGYALDGHSHDEKYYTKEEVNALIPQPGESEVIIGDLYVYYQMVGDSTINTTNIVINNIPIADTHYMIRDGDLFPEVEGIKQYPYNYPIRTERNGNHRRYILLRIDNSGLYTYKEWCKQECDDYKNDNPCEHSEDLHIVQSTVKVNRRKLLSHDLPLLAYDGNIITTLRNLFKDKFLESITLTDEYLFDTNNVTSMYGMFDGCGDLTTLDLSNWDTSNVINMERMFRGCHCLNTLDGLSNWDTRNVKSMMEMFSGCRSLTALDLSNWDTSNVIHMTGMFYECELLRELNLSNWVTDSVNTSSGILDYVPSDIRITISAYGKRGISNDMTDKKTIEPSAVFTPRALTVGGDLNVNKSLYAANLTLTQGKSDKGGPNLLMDPFTIRTSATTALFRLNDEVLMTFSSDGVKISKTYGSQTITHTTNIVSGESGDSTSTNKHIIGTFCESTGEIYSGYEKIAETDCICQVKQSTTLNSKIVGIITSENEFASHGDCLMKVVPDTYEIGDILVPNENGYGKKATNDDLTFMMLHAIPRPKITSLSTGIPDTVAVFLI